MFFITCSSKENAGTKFGKEIQNNDKISIDSTKAFSLVIKIANIVLAVAKKKKFDFIYDKKHLNV